MGGEGDGSDLEEGECAEEGKEVIVADKMRIVREEFWAVCWKVGPLSNKFEIAERLFTIAENIFKIADHLFTLAE